MSSLEYVDSCLESDFESGSVESTVDDRDEDPAHVFHGVSYTVGPLGNGQMIKAVWRYSQLPHSIYPAFMRSFRALGFEYPVSDDDGTANGLVILLLLSKLLIVI